MEPKKPSENDARKRLLEEGARSYLHAVTALIQFQKEVQNKCKKVLENHLPDYEGALKLKLRPNDIQDYTHPKFEEWEDYWNLGKNIVRFRKIQGVRWWESYTSLAFDLDPAPRLYCWVGEYFPTMRMATHIAQQFQRASPKAAIMVNEEKVVWIEETISFEHASTFDQKLEPLIEQWIRLWEKVGGMKAALKE